MGTSIAFYLSGFVTLISALRVITNTNPIHALLYLVVCLLSIACLFFTLGAPFAAALEIIVYAGAIMVLFVFVVMMLNLGSVIRQQEQQWLRKRIWIGPAILSALLLTELLIAFPSTSSLLDISHSISAKHVGMALFGPYLLAVELASMLLLAALVVAWHLGRQIDASNPDLSNKE